MTDKIIKCPKCKEEIDELYNYQSGEEKSRFFLNGDEPNYDAIDFIGLGKTNDFECYKCGEILFTNEEDAIAFLKGEDEVVSLIKNQIKIEEKRENDKYKP